MDREEIYKQDIHPLIERIALVCKQNDIPLFVSCMIEDSLRTSIVNQEKAGFDKFKLYRIINDTWDYDEMFSLIAEDAKENGHNSRILRAMGVPSNTLDSEDRKRILSENK